MFRRAALLLIPFGLITAMLAGAPASAEPSPVSSSIKAGSTGTTVGDAVFTRTTNGDGSETLTVDLSVPGGITADHLCIRDTAFTEREAPGSCSHTHDDLNGVQNDQFVVDLGTAYVGMVVYAQLHVVTEGQTAYAGWQDGQPFFGNLAIDPVGPGVSAVPLLGSLAPIGMVAVFLVGIAAVVVRRSRRAAAE